MMLSEDWSRGDDGTKVEPVEERFDGSLTKKWVLVNGFRPIWEKYPENRGGKSSFTG